MISQLHMAKSATFVFQRKMQMVADNIANSNTVGHKRHMMNMESLFPQVFERVISEFEDPNVPVGKKRRTYNEYGQGVRIAEITKDMSQGTLEITNRPLDFAVQGRGFFQVRLADGTLAYTRAGNFHQDYEGNVLDPNGHPLEPPIRIPVDTTEVIVNEEGEVFVQINNEPVPRNIGQINLAMFTNEQGLRAVGQNLYYETAASGEPILTEPGRDAAGRIRQRALEFSNVNIIEEMMQMMLTNRSFEISIKAIKAADDILKSGSDIPK